MTDSASAAAQYRYTVYGLALNSTLPLPELVARPDARSSKLPRHLHPPVADGCDVLVRMGEVESAPADAIAIGPDHWVLGGAVWLCYQKTCRMLVRNGREIVVDPVAGVEKRVLRLFILGNGLGVILHQRGLLVLHAGAVRISGGAVVFLGFSGAGKSTIAAALADRGHALVADDVVAVDMADPERPVVFPGFPQLKLYPEVARTLGHDPSALTALHPDLAKLGYRKLEGYSRKPLPLAAIYVLEEQAAAKPEIGSLKPVDGIVEIIRHSYAAGLLGAGQASPEHFQYCAAIAQHVPISRLRRAFRLSELPEVAMLVERRERKRCLAN